MWPDAMVTENALSRAIGLLRKALNDDSHVPKFIETVPTAGYRFVAKAAVVDESSAVGPITQMAAIPAAVGGGPGFRTSSKWISALVIFLLTVSALLFAVYKYIHRAEEFNLQNMKVTRLTDNGRAERLAISPDGRYVAWVVRDGEKESLWVHQVETGSDAQILPPDEVDIVGLHFSPDGAYIYFARSEKNNFNYNSLYQMASLGGTATEAVHNADSGLGFAPDGKQFTFLRGFVPKGVWRVMIADLKGSTPREIVSLQGVIFGPLVSAPVWSPDGKSIALTLVEDAQGQRSVLKIVSTADGKARSLLVRPSSDRLGQPVWLPDGRGLLLPIRQDVSGALGQIWYVSFPDGELRHFTNDPTDYATCCMDLTADGKTLAVMQNDITANLWVADSQKLDDARQITSGQPHPSALWAANGQIVTQGAKGQFIQLPSDGTNPAFLPFRQTGSSLPSVCGDGRYFVHAVINKSTSNIWRANMNDSGDPLQLTNSGSATAPSCSPDGKWVVYTFQDNRGLSTMRVSISGGTPVKLTDRADQPGSFISPDGKMVAVPVWGWPFTKPNVLKVLALDTGKELYSFERPRSRPFIFRWAPGGQAIDYVLTKDGVGNIWEQSVAGTAAKQLTHFSSEEISSFDWSSDGKQLLVSRGHANRNVILISNFQ